ncbi:MAG: DNA primase [Gemmataceae bacterium]
MADDAVIKQIKEANDIVAVVGSYVALRPAGATFKGLCPFHDDHNPSFDVDPRRQRFKCWSCNKYGDVFSFVQEHERVDFREALELLARRAGISLENTSASPQARSRALMLDIVAWAAELYHGCLLDHPGAEAARRYLGERRLTGETVRRFGLGFAPANGEWLLRHAREAGKGLELLEQVGLIGRRQEGNGFYDRFRDRILFPIRNPRGQAVGFGGRILPMSPLAERGPKYYNSSDTQLFKKSELLYGLDLARQAAVKAGYLAVVEGYTDVMMAHQMGVSQVVATMGTALNASHVRELRKFVPRVVLVFDADQGGDTGADRALQIFAGQDVDLAVATLPQGMDPCDLLVAQGAAPFVKALTTSVDALEFKLNQVLSKPDAASVEGRRRAADAVLTIIAQAPDLSGQAAAMKRELMLTRIAQRMAIKEKTVWDRLKELRETTHRNDNANPIRTRVDAGAEQPKRRAPAATIERQLLEVLLAQPALTAQALEQIPVEEIEHPGLRQLLEVMYRMQAAGQTPNLDLVRLEASSPELAEYAFQMQEIGRREKDKAGWFAQLMEQFRKRRTDPAKLAIHNQLQAAGDHEQALELLRKLQTHKDGVAN